MESYVTSDGMYAAVPWTDTKYVVIHNGKQLEDFDSLDDAKAFIKKHQTKKPRRQRAKKTTSASILDFTDKKT